MLNYSYCAKIVIRNLLAIFKYYTESEQKLYNPKYYAEQTVIRN
jgi:hypothetical protein